MDYHITWYECPYWDNVQWPWPGSIPQKSRSHGTIKGQSIHALVCAITYLCIDGIPFNFVHMFFCPIWDIVQWHWLGHILQSSRLCDTFKGHCTHVCVRAITYLCIKASAGDIAVLCTALCGLSSLPLFYHFVLMIIFCNKSFWSLHITVSYYPISSCK